VIFTWTGPKRVCAAVPVKVWLEVEEPLPELDEELDEPALGVGLALVPPAVELLLWEEPVEIDAVDEVVVAECGLRESSRTTPEMVAALLMMIRRTRSSWSVRYQKVNDSW
jgi:hypothetical protein